MPITRVFLLLIVGIGVYFGIGFFSPSEGVSTVAGAVEWFNKNRDEVLSIKNDLLTKGSNIHRVEGSIACTSNFFEVEHSRIYYDFLKRVEKIGAKHVVVSKVAVSFTLLAEGYAFAHGRLIQVEYIPDDEYVNAVSRRTKEKFYPLDVKHWYVSFDPGD